MNLLCLLSPNIVLPHGYLYCFIESVVVLICRGVDPSTVMRGGGGSIIHTRQYMPFSVRVCVCVFGERILEASPHYNMETSTYSVNCHLIFTK